MRSSNLCLLGSVVLITGACGARTGDFEDYYYDAGYFNELGGQGPEMGGSGNNWAGGVPSLGGWYPVGGWYSAGGWYTGTGGWYSGGRPTTVPQGCYGCSCYSNYTCNYPYICSYGTCTYNYATGGSYPGCTGDYGCSCYPTGYCNYPYTCMGSYCGYSTTGGTTSCPPGSWGCSCYSNYTCNYPYNCVSGICSTVVAGGASWGGTTAVGGAYLTGGVYPVGGRTVNSTGGRPPLGGALTGGSPFYTGGNPAIVNCTNSLASCVADTDCANLIACLLSSSQKCAGDLTCYALACQSYIGGPSAQLELQIIQNCGSFMGL